MWIVLPRLPFPGAAECECQRRWPECHRRADDNVLSGQQPLGDGGGRDHGAPERRRPLQVQAGDGRELVRQRRRIHDLSGRRVRSAALAGAGREGLPRDAARPLGPEALAERLRSSWTCAARHRGPRAEQRGGHEHRTQRPSPLRLLLRPGGHLGGHAGPRRHRLAAQRRPARAGPAADGLPEPVALPLQADGRRRGRGQQHPEELHLGPRREVRLPGGPRLGSGDGPRHPELREDAPVRLRPVLLRQPPLLLAQDISAVRRAVGED
mmetsp:Transcript_10616/g.28834  ORF Transcript_10616/g.28834 Transcript_10616/m.28834 type:complete len:267 (-) Transcript_10616:247-1047(-)